MGGDRSKQAARKDGSDDRARRLAEALRENLHRRKSQARQRKAGEAPKGDEDDRSGT